MIWEASLYFFLNKFVVGVGQWEHDKEETLCWCPSSNCKVGRWDVASSTTIA